MTNIWAGERVRLRAIEPEDWEVFFDWDQDTDFARLTYHIPFPGSRERAKKWASEQAAKQQANDEFTWVIENHQGDFVGVINSHTCEPRQGTFRYGLAIQRAHWRQGYAVEAVRLVLRYFFDELRYHKVNVDVYAFNAPSLALHQALGFVEEGRLREMIYTEGRHHDLILLGMTREEYLERARKP